MTDTTVKEYTFDAAGRMTGAEITSTVSGTATALKDLNGNIVQTVNESIAPTVYKTVDGEYTYNGEDKRVRKNVSTDWDSSFINEGDEYLVRKYYYSGDAVLFTADTSNRKTIENICDLNGNVLMSARFEEDSEGYVRNGWYTFLSDIRGSTEAILDSGGDLVTGYVYDEFGNRIVTGETDFVNETTYTGRIYDEETSLYYMNSRYYDSRTGQFLSRDSCRGDEYSPWTQNLYTYTSNNPVNYVDPTGHFGIAALTVASMVANALSGGFYGWISAKQNGASLGNTIICIVIGVFIGAATSYISSLANVYSAISVAVMSGCGNALIDSFSKSEDLSLSESDKLASLNTAFVWGAVVGVASQYISIQKFIHLNPTGMTGLEKATACFGQFTASFAESIFWNNALFGLGQIELFKRPIEREEDSQLRELPNKKRNIFSRRYRDNMPCLI